jgi:hypothetical protein
MERHLGSQRDVIVIWKISSRDSHLESNKCIHIIGDDTVVNEVPLAIVIHNHLELPCDSVFFQDVEETCLQPSV